VSERQRVTYAFHAPDPAAACAAETRLGAAPLNVIASGGTL
jgi:hypothetical protein